MTCSLIRCNKPTYNKIKMRCLIHCPNIACLNPDCGKRPSFNYQGEKKGKYCFIHRLDGMVNVRDRKCKHPDCGKRPNFNDPTEYLGIYCLNHKLPGMVSVKSNICLNSNCQKQPNFNYFSEKKPIYCSEHKLYGMLDIVNKKCNYPSCTIKPSFNDPGQSKGLYCKKHRIDGMINVTDRKCIYSGCLKRPTFNNPNETKGLYCYNHKLHDMVNVKSIICFNSSCKKTATFNNPKETAGLYCSHHKLEGMTNVLTKTCKKCDCPKVPIFNNPSEHKGIYCSDHKLPGMVDVLTAKCIYYNCKKTAPFGLLFEKKIHCAQHKSNNEYRNNNPKCSSEKCRDIPLYTNDNTAYPKRCEVHKLSDDINIIERECSKCYLSYFIPNDRTDCNDCYEFFVKRIGRVKEGRILKLFESNDISFESHDRTIQEDTKCSNKRPDFVIDKGTYKIIVEVDEDQHKTYQCSCEQTRMAQLYFDLGGLNLVIIRYNPDSYKDQYNNKITPNNECREKSLLNFLRCFDNVQTISDSLRIYYMYYDGYSGNPERFVMDPYLINTR